MDCNTVVSLLPQTHSIIFQIHTQLDDVSNDAHDEETHAHGLRDAEEFAAISYGIVLSATCAVQGFRAISRSRTLAAAGQETLPVLEKLSRDLEELLCLVHCEGMWGCMRWMVVVINEVGGRGEGGSRVGGGVVVVVLALDVQSRIMGKPAGAVEI